MVTGSLSILAGVSVGLASLVLSITVSKAFGAVFLVAAWWTFFWFRRLRSAWPAGIWVDGTGIRIGDVRALPFATADSHSVFTCAWPAVCEITVSGGSDPSRPASTTGQRRPARRYWWAHLLLAPVSSRGYLHIQLDPAAAPQHLDPRSVHGLFTMGDPPVWVAPTRHPDQLRAALALVRGQPPATELSAEESSPPA
jgi:hypothetical protein